MHICEFLNIEKPKSFKAPSYTVKGELKGDFFDELTECTDNSIKLLKNYLVTPDGKYGINREERGKGYKYQALYAYKLYFKQTDDENILSYLDELIHQHHDLLCGYQQEEFRFQVL